ncbi:alpha/beta-hydrolase [Roridomyces roridus]|uniref:Alpha/beta-hydrolase n=1 Tax=Roridomyces roridus TaxID=1738132 RepID=A0AAD7BX46_9AGAR|nr:alpha/beta-hydrolase [Roridomyces roridus]
MVASVESLSTIFDTSTCTRRGFCPVTRLRNQVEALESHSLYYEIHGSGPQKVALIMGLNSSCFAWLGQVEHFGRMSDYSVLVFDNRGVGHSEAPRGPYSTSGMAEDAKVLLDYVGWTEERGIHVVGISLGGMIAQELATRIPERIASLVIAVSTPGGRAFWNNLPPWKGLKLLAKLTFTADHELKIPLLLDLLYPTAWTDDAAEDDDQGRINREIQTQIYRRRLLCTAPQGLVGALSQMASALSHHVSAERLRAISDDIPKVVIVTGDDDNLVLPSNSKRLKNCMPDAEFVQWEHTGHALHVQRPKKFNELLERTFKEGRRKAGGSWD